MNYPGIFQKEREPNVIAKCLLCLLLLEHAVDEAPQSSLSYSVSHSLLKFMSVELVMLSKHHPLPPGSRLPSIFLSITVFSNESSLHIRWSKYLSFSFASVLPVDIQGWFPLGWTGLILQCKGLRRVFSSTTIKHQFFSSPAPQLSINSSLLQHHNEASILLFSSSTIKHQFFAQPSLCSSSHIHTWLLEKPQQRSDVSAF